MLRQEKHLAQVKVAQHIKSVPFARRCAAMNNSAGAAITHKPSRCPKSEAEVLILRVHEKLLIEKTDFVESFPPQHQARAVDPINRAIDKRTVENWLIGSPQAARSEFDPGSLECLIQGREKVSGVAHLDAQCTY